MATATLGELPLVWAGPAEEGDSADAGTTAMLAATVAQVAAKVVAGPAVMRRAAAVSAQCRFDVAATAGLDGHRLWRTPADHSYPAIGLGIGQNQEHLSPAAAVVAAGPAAELDLP